MGNFISDSIAKTSRDRRNIKNQFGGTGDIDEYSILKIENIKVEAVNLIVKVDGVETIKKRYDWTTTTDYQKGVKSANMRWDGNVLQIG